MMSARLRSERVMNKMSVIYLDGVREKQGKVSNSDSQSTQKPQLDKTGLQLTDEEMEELGPIVAIYSLLQRARVAPFTCKSDIARKAAEIIAVCACEGLLTTRLEDELYGNRWMVTEDGLIWMQGFEDAFTN